MVKSPTLGQASFTRGDFCRAFFPDYLLRKEQKIADVEVVVVVQSS